MQTVKQLFSMLVRFFAVSNKRELSGPLATAVFIFSIVLILFQMWAMLFGTLPPYIHNAIFTTCLLAISFLLYGRPKKKENEKISYWDIGIAIIWLVACLYILFNMERFVTRWPLVDPLSVFETALALFMLIFAVDVTRRTLGAGMTVIVLVLLAYALFGHLLPGIFSHRKLTIDILLDRMIYTYDGVFGTIATVVTTYVFFFVLFGNFLNAAGGGDFFNNLASALTWRSVGGPAKVAIVSSAFYGTISGSPTSDVMTTGTFTIPTMKKAGFSPVYAGAVEAVAATGGAILPPVMGSAAFLMAEFTGIPYVQIAIAGIVPALLYYICIYAQVHFQALRNGLHAKTEEVLGVKEVMRTHGQFLIPIVLLVGLMIKGYTPMFSALIALLATIVVSWLRKETRLGPRLILETMHKTIIQLTPLVGVSSGAGIVVGVIALTGVASKFLSFVAVVANGNTFIAFLMTMVVTLILGMGMPIPAAYVLAVVMSAPVLTDLGISILQTHMFIVYFAAISAVTPPVAVAAYAAASIADADPFKIGWQACRLGIVSFVVPYIFVYQPELLLQGSVAAIIPAIVTSVIGAIALASSLEGWAFMRNVWWERIALAIGGLLLLFPGWTTDLVGVILVGAFVILQLYRRKGIVMGQKDKKNMSIIQKE